VAEPRVVVVGAGIAGLTSALLLAHQGVAVTVVDAAATPGGKLRQITVDGACIDSGPTVFTMRWVFDQVLASVGAQLESELRLQALPVIARHFWDDGSSLDLWADPAASLDAVARLAGPAEARRFAAFCALAREVYDTLEEPFIRSPVCKPLDMVSHLGVSGLRVLWRLGALQDLWSSLQRQFADPRLQQLFGRYATYCGSSPWQAPATLMLIAQVEMDGVWAIDGGMHSLAQALMRLAQARGAVFRFASPCEAIECTGGRVSGVRLRSGELLCADRVIFNGDVAALRAGLLGAEPAQRTRLAASARSLSALTWSIRAPTSGLTPDRHNVFFQGDYEREFTDIFDHRRLPRRPTVYLCAQDRGSGPPVAGAERLLCLVNAPAVGGEAALTDEAIESCERESFSLLRRCGLNLQPQPHQVVRTTPDDFHRLFPATGGALYGQATHGWMSAFARPSAPTRLPGLFLAGGSVHPGPGVPMAALSGQWAAAALMDSLASTSRSRRAATSGGMSMASAMTDSTASR